MKKILLLCLFVMLSCSNTIDTDVKTVKHNETSSVVKNPIRWVEYEDVVVEDKPVFIYLHVGSGCKACNIQKKMLNNSKLISMLNRDFVAVNIDVDENIDDALALHTKYGISPYVPQFMVVGKSGKIMHKIGLTKIDDLIVGLNIAYTLNLLLGMPEVNVKIDI